MVLVSSRVEVRRLPTNSDQKPEKERYSTSIIIVVSDCY